MIQVQEIVGSGSISVQENENYNNSSILGLGSNFGLER